KLWEFTGIDPLINNVLESIGLERFPNTWGILFIMLVVTIIIKLLVDYYLKTEIGLALRATGNNQKMIRSFSANTDILIIMGIGLIIIGLASVIIGEALFGVKTIARATLAVIGGAIVYRIVVTLALRFEFLDTGDMKLITALLVIIALITPKFMENYRTKKRRKEKRAKIESEEA